MYTGTHMSIRFNAIHRETNNMLLFTDRLRKIHLSFVVFRVLLASLFFSSRLKCCSLTVNYLFARVCVCVCEYFLTLSTSHTYTSTWFRCHRSKTVVKPSVKLIRHHHHHHNRIGPSRRFYTNLHEGYTVYGSR